MSQLLAVMEVKGVGLDTRIRDLPPLYKCSFAYFPSKSIPETLRVGKPHEISANAVYIDGEVSAMTTLSTLLSLDGDLRLGDCMNNAGWYPIRDSPKEDVATTDH